MANKNDDKSLSLTDNEQDFPSIGQAAPATNFQEIYVKPEDVLGKLLLFLSFERIQGKLGEYFLIKCVDRQEGVEFTLSTGAKIVKQQMNTMYEWSMLPALGVIRRNGQQYYIGE